MRNQLGQVFILALIVLTVVTISTVAIIGGALTFNQNSKNSTEMIQATNLAEAGIDKAVASLNKSGGNYNGEGVGTNGIELGPGEYTVTITSKNASTNLVSSTGYVPNKVNPKAKKTVQIEVSRGAGVSFNYGLQTGQGGVHMDQNAILNGNLYSNGNVTMDQNTRINGDVSVAGGTQASADQQSDCSGVNCSIFIFGKNVSGNNQLDVAQSFNPQTQTAQTINKVSLKLKKYVSPPNALVRIMQDLNGKPDKGNILTSGTLAPIQVPTDPSSAGWVDVTFSPVVSLNPNQTYWIMIDTSNDNSNYWGWSMDTLQGYTGGNAKWSPDWNTGNPVWNSISGDLDFKTYMGGVITSIVGNHNDARVTGNVYANSISDLIIGKDAYYDQSIQNSTVSGQNCTNNTHCHPGSTDQPALVMPISDANIQEWKDQAAVNTFSGNITNCPSSLASGKYIGSITTPQNCNITVNTPIWITENLTLSQGTKLVLNSSYGISSGVIIASQIIDIEQNSKLYGSCGAADCTVPANCAPSNCGSYLILISEFNSQTDPQNRDAILIDQGGQEGVIYAGNGSIKLDQNNKLTEITAWKLNLGQGVIIDYKQGYSSNLFVAGPSGSFSVIKGSYLSK